MFHILEMQPTKVHWCWLAGERGHLHCIPHCKHRFSCYAWRLSEAVVAQPNVALPAPVTCGIPQVPQRPCGVLSLEDFLEWRGTPPNRSLPSTAGPAAGDRETTIACVFSGAKSDSTDGDRSLAVWLPQRLKVTHTLHLHLEYHGESRHVTSVMEGGEMWLLSGIVVFNIPHGSSLHLVQEGEVFIGRASPRETRLLQGGANLRLVEDF
ncbi:hypothetical protein GWK47_031571 [Chionoecetes opilio]|uniref:Uncharacterized protein n=1 Tax=Chionoecetes opilio TaxID=41210 RepID=A0A8J5D146_CHIOP|nr:hypothetical protein GWK47_031571 [Chionoecetes opilio]